MGLVSFLTQLSRENQAKGIFGQLSENLPQAASSGDAIGQLIAQVAPDTQPTAYQSYQSSLAKLAQIDPGTYGGAALSALAPPKPLTPVELLDARHKQIMNANDENNSAVQGLVMKRLFGDSNQSNPPVTPVSADTSALGQVAGLPSSQIPQIAQQASALQQLSQPVAQPAQNISSPNENLGAPPTPSQYQQNPAVQAASQAPVNTGFVFPSFQEWTSQNPQSLINDGKIDLGSAQRGYQSAKNNALAVYRTSPEYAQQKANTDAGVFGQGGGITSDLHGDDYLSTLPQNVANQVKAIAEGRQQAPSGFSSRSAFGRNLMSAVEQYDPEFNQLDYQTRLKTRKEFTSGAPAKSITALNTAIEHLNTLAEKGESLDSGSIPALNYVTNAYRSETGDKRVAGFNTAKNTLAQEIVSAYKGAGGNAEDVKSQMDNLSPNASKAQRTEVLGTIATLMKGKIDALQEQYQNGMGKYADKRSFYTPKAISLFQKFGVDIAGDTQAEQPYTAEGSQAQPQSTSTQEITAHNPQTGETIVLRNGQWVKQ